MASSILDDISCNHFATITTAHMPDETAFAFSCIVVAQGARQDMLVASAKRAGWDAIQPTAAANAAAYVREHSAHLLIVDLSGSQSNDECRELLEKLAGQHGLLLLVCGNESDPAEEIWARGLGIWLYLPGVPKDADLSSLCADALRITERNAPRTIELPLAAQKMRRAR